MLPISAAVTIVGLGLVGVGDSSVGAILTLLGLVALMASIHKLGRLGFETAPRSRHAPRER
jgi:hypothetical protein